jgi:hypothetical protein
VIPFETGTGSHLKQFVLTNSVPAALGPQSWGVAYGVALGTDWKRYLPSLPFKGKRAVPVLHC